MVYYVEVFFFYFYFVTLNSYTESEIGRIFSKDKIAEEYLHFPSILPAGAEIWPTISFNFAFHNKD